MVKFLCSNFRVISTDYSIFLHLQKIRKIMVIGDNYLIILLVSQYKVYYKHKCGYFSVASLPDA